MNVLSVETSSNVCGVALSSDGVLVSVCETFVGGRHEAVLRQLVQCTLSAGSCSPSNLDVVAISSGPGSFTGLRIGVSFVKGLCFMDKPKLLPVPTLRALASAAEEVAVLAGKRHILTVIPSHRNLCYAQLFSRVSNEVMAFSPTEQLCITPVETLRERSLDGTLVCGPGAGLIQSNAVSGLSRLSARFVNKYALQLITSGLAEYANPLTFEPEYHQDFTSGSGKQSPLGKNT